MLAIVVGHLIAHAGIGHERAAIFQFSVDVAFKHQNNVAFAAPVIGTISRGVFDHSNADVAEFKCSPEGVTLKALVAFRLDL